MILQTIQLPFDAGTADTIYTKQGETGRGIWFDFPFDIPAAELDNYKCEFIAVKPDDTFVIEDAGLSTHGEGEGDDIVYHTIAQLTLPEQVSAAKGTGSYIIKIYDYVHDNDLIYSAAGGLYVDDHLLLDSLIESIAEANGYNFPDDFATIGDLGTLINDSVIAEDRTWSSNKISAELGDVWEAIGDLIDDDSTGENATWSSTKISEELSDMADDIADLIDDNATSADSTWSSSKIADELGNIDLLHRYDTTERIIGKWVDGTTDVYERSIILDNPTKQSSGSLYYYEYADSDNHTGMLFLQNASVYDQYNQRWYVIPYERLTSSESIKGHFHVVNNEIRFSIFFSNSQGYNLTKIVVIVRYTKV